MAQGRRRDDSVALVGLLAEPTRRRLYELVAASAAPVSRDEAGRALGISRDLAAFHLDRLAGGGLLLTEYRRPPGRRGPGAGRPAKLYRRATNEVAVALPPRTYGLAAELMATALDRLGEPSGRGTLTSVARDRGFAAGAALRGGAINQADATPPKDRLVEALTGLGYEPMAEPGTATIELRNCPFHALAETHRDLTCHMNLAWTEGLVSGLGVAVMPRLAPRQDRCCVVFDLAGRPPDAS